MAESYTNIRTVLDKIMRHPLLKDVSLETVVDYTVDFMRIVGTPAIFEDKTIKLKVKNYRACLPEDYYKVIHIKDSKGNMFKYCDDVSSSKSNLTYKIQGNIIYTSIENDCIELIYKAIVVDDEGCPLIPDNSSFTRALSAYIKKQWFTILFDLGKVHSTVLQHAEQEYAWAVGDCQTEFNRLTLDKAESFYDSWRSLLIK